MEAHIKKIKEMFNKHLDKKKKQMNNTITEIKKDRIVEITAAEENKEQ